MHPDKLFLIFWVDLSKQYFIEKKPQGNIEAIGKIGSQRKQLNQTIGMLNQRNTELELRVTELEMEVVKLEREMEWYWIWDITNNWKDNYTVFKVIWWQWNQRSTRWNWNKKESIKWSCNKEIQMITSMKQLSTT